LSYEAILDSRFAACRQLIG